MSQGCRVSKEEAVDSLTQAMIAAYRSNDLVWEFLDSGSLYLLRGLEERLQTLGIGLLQWFQALTQKQIIQVVRSFYNKDTFWCASQMMWYYGVHSSSILLLLRSLAI